MAKKVSKTIGIFSESLSPIYRIWAWILLAWTLYRYFFRFPEWVDEFLFKPVVFVLPVLWYVIQREKRHLDSVGITKKNFITSLYIGIGFGAVFAIEGILAHYVKYKSFVVNPIAAFGEYGFGLLIISLATAFSEELLCRGFLFSRLLEKTKKLLPSLFVGAALFLFLHVPMLLMINKLQGVTLVTFIITDFILAIANSMLYLSTGSIVAPILVHIFWNMTVALYL
jgi:membrane protease YdiL (CAAX protease family)